MSDYTAIRGATLSLKTLLDDGLNVAPAPPDRLKAEITVSRPDVKQSIAQGNRLNLFLYQVIVNQWLSNQEDPRVGTTSDYGRPPLSLNLRYLITPFSTDTDETEAHRVLGAAMRVLHDNAILLPTLMTSGGQPVLDTSLLGAREHLRISPLPLTVDDMAKISTNAQESLRLSVGYEVLVVQIDSTLPRVSPLPVKERNVIITMGGPRIASVETDIVGIGDTLVIHGSNFASQTTKVLIGGALVDLSGLGAPRLRAERIEIIVPDDTSLWPGAQMVRVETGFDETNAVASGTFPKTVTSNPAPIILSPKITSLVPVSEAAAASHTLTINGERLYRAADAANIYVLIANLAIPASQFTVKTATHIAVTLPNLPRGQYSVHVRFNAFVSRDTAVFEVT